MKRIVDVPEEDYMYCLREEEEELATELESAIANSVALNGLTNGEVLMKMFPDATITQKNKYVVFLEIDRYGEPKLFDATWWNAKWGE